MSMSAFIVVLALLCGAQALGLQERAAPSVLSFPLARQEIKADSLHRRDHTVSAQAENTFDINPFYMYNISIGTPPQQIPVQIDTTTGYLAVVASNSSTCTETPNQVKACTQVANFHINASSTCQGTNDKFNVTYQIDKPLWGGFVTDVVTIAGVSVPDTRVAVAYSGDYYNILGLGYVVEQPLGSGPKNSNTSLPYRLAETGHIKSAAYSIWMDQDDVTATILFGGVDTTKYSGSLHTFPVPSVNGVYYMPGVMVTGIVLQTNVTKRVTSPPAFYALDMGLSETLVPDAVFLDIFEKLGGKASASILTYETLPCTVAQSNYNITFSFSGVDLVVPLRNFVGAQHDDGTCAIHLNPSGGDWGVLGVNSLRAAYVVYDLSNNEVSLAQRDFGPTSNGSHILEISHGPNAVEGAVSVSVTVSGAIPTASDRGNWQYAPFPTSSKPITSTSTDAGVSPPTGNPFALVAGIIGAGLVLV